MAELAAKIGINQVPLGRIERGVNAPSASVTYRLAKALGVSVDTLFAEHEKDFRSLQHESSRDPFLVPMDKPDEVLPPKLKVMAQDIIDAFWALEDTCNAQKQAKIPLLIPFEPSRQGMEILSETVRRYIGIEHGVVFDYFELFENQGFRVIVVPMPKTMDSFSYYDPLCQNAFFFSKLPPKSRAAAFSAGV